MESMVEVRPVHPAAAYVGGKRRLAKRVIEEIARWPHQIYAEGFVGMGGVFLRRPRAPRAEVINDASREVATFFRILQRHYPQFMDMLRFQVSSRAAFERLVKTDPTTLTDLEQSARFLYLQRLAYGGKVVGRHFGVDPRGGSGFNLNRLAPLLDDLHERLAGVTIECLDFEDFLRRYDTPETLFYLDPPYWGSEGYYGKALFSGGDFGRLAAALSRLQGAFIVSLNDCPEVRACFAGMTFESVSTRYSVGGGAGVRAEEVLITKPRPES